MASKDYSMEKQDSDYEDIDSDDDNVFEENSEKSQSDILLQIKTEISGSVKMELSDPELEMSERNLEHIESDDK